MTSRQFKSAPNKRDLEAEREERTRFEAYQAFMIGYVRRVNEASFNVTIGGVRIGSAKSSRLAQINLQSRIITFSRFAVDNVPERGRRYLVLHELAHVKEANHNKRFWSHVERYEPEYKTVSNELQHAFRKNVREEQLKLKKLAMAQSLLTAGRDLKDSGSTPSNRLLNYKVERPAKTTGGSHEQSVIITPRYGNGFKQANSGNSDENFECMEDEFDLWDLDDVDADGTVSGGSELISLPDDYLQTDSDAVQLKLAFG
jgi:hypothetical protein